MDTKIYTPLNLRAAAVAVLSEGPIGTITAMDLVGEDWAQRLASKYAAHLRSIIDAGGDCEPPSIESIKLLLKYLLSDAGLAPQQTFILQAMDDD